MTVEEFLAKLHRMMDEDPEVAKLELYMEIDGECHTYHYGVDDAIVETSVRYNPWKKHVKLI